VPIQLEPQCGFGTVTESGTRNGEGLWFSSLRGQSFETSIEGPTLAVGTGAQIYHAENFLTRGVPRVSRFSRRGAFGRGHICLPAHELSTGELPVIQPYQTALVAGIVTNNCSTSHLRRLHQPPFGDVGLCSVIF